jgi:two-component system response regulator YesN
MYSVIIVDDEEAVRHGLATHFNWEKHGAEVVGTFEDGLAAWNYLQEHPVDIITTDVRMPQMDGITLSRNALEKYPHTKIIFISAYADVNYIRDAMKLEAADYILKSVDLDELDAVVAKTIKKIETERNREQTMLDMQQKLKESMPYMREQRLRSLLTENDETEEIMQQELQFLGIGLKSDTEYLVMVVRLQPKSKWAVMTPLSEAERLVISLRIDEIIGEETERYEGSVHFKSKYSEYVTIIPKHLEEFEKILLSVAHRVQIDLQQKLGLETMIGISDICMGLKNIRGAYRNACEAINHSYRLAADSTISVEKFENTPGKIIREKCEAEIKNAILSGDTEEVKKSWQTCINYIRTCENETEQQNLLLYFLQLPVPLLSGLRPEDQGPYASLRRLMEQFFLSNGLNEQGSMIGALFEEAAGLLQKASSPHANSVIKRVREIIDQKYMDQISVTILSDMVSLTPTYLCVLFKQETGQTVNEYLTGVRLNRAKEFLSQTNIRLYDVCYKVGYLSPSYFTRLFKKSTGLTPGEYREKITGEPS